MPGVQACGRCGALLQLGAMTFGVHPPRAGVWTKRWRRWFRWSRIHWRAAGEAAGRELLGSDVGAGPPWPVMARMVAPGWPQFYQGDRIRGWCFLSGYCSLAVLALTTFGTFFGSVCLGLAIATHAASVLDVVLGATRQSRGRMTYALVCLIAVGLSVYAPLGYLAGGMLVPQRITANLPPFSRGDVVLTSTAIYSIFRSPRPGDVVLYEAPHARIQGRYGGWAANIDIQGLRIDRVLAAAGQHVHIEGGMITIDGQPSRYLPLNPARMPVRFDANVPPGCFLILPTTALTERFNLQALDWAHASVVREDQIRSRVYLRHWPWLRFTLL
jgi:hypothetical protein